MDYKSNLKPIVGQSNYEIPTPTSVVTSERCKSCAMINSKDEEDYADPTLKLTLLCRPNRQLAQSHSHHMF